jgi:hypothetical protein
MHDCHLSYITKLEKKRMFHTWFFDLEFFAMEETYNIISKRKKLCYMCEVV